MQWRLKFEPAMALLLPTTDIDVPAEVAMSDAPTLVMLRIPYEITYAFDSLELGALRRCESLVWLATRHASRLALHPNPAAKCASYFVTDPNDTAIPIIFP